MNYFVISFSYKNTDITLREKLAFNDNLTKETFISKLLAYNHIDEVILLSTCNRVETIIYGEDGELVTNIVLRELAKHAKVPKPDIKDKAIIFEGEEAINHIFSVASALDSLVVGETQILGQLKDAFRLSLKNKFCKVNLKRAINYSVKCASKVRSTTHIGENPVSVASAAVLKADEIFEESNISKEAIVVGAGEMSALTIKHLLKKNFKVRLISRNLKKANLLATTFDDEVSVTPYDELEKFLNSSRVMFTATSAPHPIIKDTMVTQQQFSRYWFDIAVPRDIENIKIENLSIYTVDDLQDIVAKNLSLRQEQSSAAQEIIYGMTNNFYKWIDSLGVEPMLKELYTYANEIIDTKLQQAISKGFIAKDDEYSSKKLAQSVINEFLHIPASKLRELSQEKKSDRATNVLLTLFNKNIDN
jgi:glutamyl-tRNA reductase